MSWQYDLCWDDMTMHAACSAGIGLALVLLPCIKLRCQGMYSELALLCDSCWLFVLAKKFETMMLAMTDFMAMRVAC